MDPPPTENRGHGAKILQPSVVAGANHGLVDRYGANAVHVLGAYNAGPGAMDRWIDRYKGFTLDELAERIPYTETRNYVRKTLESYMIYHALYDPPAKDGTDDG